MQRWATRLQAKIFNVALGAEETTARIHVRSNIEQSTLFDEVGQVPIVAEYEVPVRRFDAIIGAFARPALCKIDVQGAEVGVLQGMGDRLREIDAFIIEASPLPTFAGGPDLYDVMHLMHAQGYALYDIVGVYRRPLDQALAQIDGAFVPSASPLRQDRRWA
jgi:hypothetical protein